MSNIKFTIVNNKVRYSAELSPGSTVEAGTLAEILNFLLQYGASNGKT